MSFAQNGPSLSCVLQEYSVEFSCYFNVMWVEPRLHIPHNFLLDLNITDKALVTCINRDVKAPIWSHLACTWPPVKLLTGQQSTMFPVNLELVNHLWLPNVFIYNLRTFKV